MKSLEALYHLRHVVTFSAFFLMSLGSFGQNSIDSLLRVLDNAINNRELYLNAREKDIRELKDQRSSLRSEREIYSCNSRIADRYESFVSDSAKKYLS